MFPLVPPSILGMKRLYRVFLIMLAGPLSNLHFGIVGFLVPFQHMAKVVQSTYEFGAVSRGVQRTMNFILSMKQ